MNLASDNDQHKENILTEEFTQWFKEATGYIELHDDMRTAGDPFDSAGYIGDRLVLIEFKDSINVSLVNHEGSAGTTIEKKISEVLREVYYKQDTKIFNAISSRYNDFQIPTILIVANRVSQNAKEALEIKLKKRSRDWRFNYQVIEWKEGVPVMKEFENNEAAFSNTKIEVPKFKSTAPKRKNKLTKTSTAEILSDFGLLDFWEMLLDLVKRKQWTIIYQANSIGIINPETGHSMIGIWPKRSSKKLGLRLTYSVEQINIINPRIKSFEDIGLPREDKKLGFLGSNGFINSRDEMETLIRILDT